MGAGQREASGSRTWPALLWLVVGLLASRLLVSAAVPVLPDMEPLYIEHGRRLLETDERFNLYLSPTYALLLHAVHAVVGNWLIASHLLFVVFSTLSALAVYLCARRLAGARAATLAAVIVALLPNLAAAVVGYSHLPVVGLCFLYFSFYGHLRLILDGDSVQRALLAGGAAAMSILLRPEYLLYFVALLAVWTALRLRGPARGRFVGCATLASALVVGALLGNHQLLRARSSTAVSLTGNARYSYNTYMHTLSLRSIGVIDDREMELRAREAFGPAEENGWSIARAVRRNPKEAAKNLAYNTKDLLENLAHPLFVPFFLYLPVGLGLASALRAGRRDQLLLLTLIVPCLATLLIFHLEIRYMSPLLLPLVLWAAVGLETLDRPFVTRGLLTLLAGLFLVYAAHMRSARQPARASQAWRGTPPTYSFPHLPSMFWRGGETDERGADAELVGVPWAAGGRT